jgi:hypothetical protein
VISCHPGYCEVNGPVDAAGYEGRRLVELGAGDVILAPGVVEMLKSAAGVVGVTATLEANIAEALDHGLIVEYRFKTRTTAGEWSRGFFAWTVVAAVALDPAPPPRPLNTEV